jgi:hypothetical protein
LSAAYQWRRGGWPPGSPAGVVRTSPRGTVRGDHAVPHDGHDLLTAPSRGHTGAAGKAMIVWHGDKHRFAPVPGWSRVCYCLGLRLIIPFIPKRKLGFFAYSLEQVYSGFIPPGIDGLRSWLVPFHRAARRRSTLLVQMCIGGCLPNASNRRTRGATTRVTGPRTLRRPDGCPRQPIPGSPPRRSRGHGTDGTRPLTAPRSPAGSPAGSPGP